MTKTRPPSLWEFIKAILANPPALFWLVLAAICFYVALR